MGSSLFRLSVRQLLAPTRIVTDVAMHGGYDMGLAATADRVEIALPDFELDEDELGAAEAALEAVMAAKRAHDGQRPLSEAEAARAEAGELPPPSPGEQLRRSQKRLADIAHAVAEGDRALTALCRRGLELIVTTWEEPVLAFNYGGDAAETAAQVSIRRIRSGNLRRA